MPLELFENLKHDDVNTEEVLKNQIKFKSDLIEIKTRNPQFKSEDQMSSTQNIEKLFNLREKVVILFKDYSFLLSEAEYKTKHGKGPKLLTFKQMLQRLPIALVRVKAGNTSENWLNGIRQIIYCLHRAKEITKKVYNNIMNSIKL